MELANEVFQLIERLSFEPRIKSYQNLSGRYISPKSGASPDFLEFRQYREGEPSNTIDWRASGRLGKLLVRTNEHQGLIKNWLVLDGSGSMGFPKEKSKYEYQLMLFGALMYLFNGQGDPIGSILSHHEEGMSFNPSRTWNGLTEMVRYIADVEPGGDTHLLESIQALMPKLQRNSHIWITTDFDRGLRGLETVIEQMASEGHDVRIVHMYHPWEREMPWNGECKYEDMESNYENVLIRPEDIKEAYLKAYDEFQHEISETVKSKGALYYHVDCSLPIVDHIIRILED